MGYHAYYHIQFIVKKESCTENYVSRSSGYQVIIRGNGNNLILKFHIFHTNSD